MRSLGITAALVAALLFGLATPLAKLLLSSVPPALLAGLLYLGSGTGLGLILLVRRLRGRAPGEAPLERRHWPWLAGAVVTGGVLAPLAMMAGLASTPASSAALLLNLEGVATALLAWFLFRENFDRRIALGMSLIVAGGMFLSWDGGRGWVITPGAGLILLACLGWGLDNNLTQKVSAQDPVQVAALKGGVAGVVNTALALATGARLEELGSVPAALLVGFLGYGVSLVLFVVGLRHIGTARTGAYFSTAPFVGAAAALVLLPEPAGPGFWVAALLMAVGVWLHLTEVHEHEHTHEPETHSHRHVHDEHHQHEHPPGTDPSEPHTHEHAHGWLTHRHPHFPDIHHRHGHG